MNKSESRRAFFQTATAAAAASVTTCLPALAGQADPIFAAIENHRRSSAAFHKVDEDTAHMVDRSLKTQET